GAEAAEDSGAVPSVVELVQVLIEIVVDRPAAVLLVELPGFGEMSQALIERGDGLARVERAHELMSGQVEEPGAQPAFRGAGPHRIEIVKAALCGRAFGLKGKQGYERLLWVLGG